MLSNLSGRIHSSSYLSWGVSSLSSTSHAVGATWRGLAVGEIIEYSRVPMFVLDVKLRAGEFEVLLLNVISCSSTQPANLAWGIKYKNTIFK